MPPTYAFFSTQTTRRPRFASNAVAARPLCPAPTTTTSTSSTLVMSSHLVRRVPTQLALLHGEIQTHGKTETGEQADDEVDPRLPHAAPPAVDDGPQREEEDVGDDHVLPRRARRR